MIFAISFSSCGTSNDSSSNASSTQNSASTETSSATLEADTSSSSNATAEITGGSGISEGVTTTDSKAVTLSNGTESKSNLSISTSTKDESAVKVTGGTLTLTDCIIDKSGDTSSEDNSNFYGLNAAVLATSGATIKLINCTIITNGDGANAVFATGSGSTITLENCKITTSKDSSRGLDATLTGTVKANGVTITTAGAHCATLATDRGEGTVIVDNAILNTAGDGSPIVYSTGDIQLSNATGTATDAQAAVIEGKNSITLTDCYLTGSTRCGVMVYQSFSGDADVGQGTFTMTGGSLTALVGPAFYSTNTTGVINITNVEIKAESLLTTSEDRWGTSGSNGAKITFTASDQVLTGDIACNSISSISVIMKNSTLNGAADSENKGTVSMELDSSSKWTLTGNCYLKKLTNADSSAANITKGSYSITTK